VKDREAAPSPRSVDGNPRAPRDPPGTRAPRRPRCLAADTPPSSAGRLCLPAGRSRAGGL